MGWIVLLKVSRETSAARGCAAINPGLRARRIPTFSVAKKRMGDGSFGTFWRVRRPGEFGQEKCRATRWPKNASSNSNPVVRQVLPKTRGTGNEEAWISRRNKERECDRAAPRSGSGRKKTHFLSFQTGQFPEPLEPRYSGIYHRMRVFRQAPRNWVIGGGLAEPGCFVLHGFAWQELRNNG